MILRDLSVCWTSLLVLTLVILSAMSSDAGDKYVSVDFEVFGNVQGVCFRMYTEAEGKKLGVTGWVKNTRQGTVVGQVQGPPEKVKEMAVGNGDPRGFVSRRSSTRPSAFELQLPSRLCL
ncbi:acylphosphatase-2 isoform X2 [Danio aesculapii]|uniref:acylphosphatase-2 isoform X2 n=1 Tax=Danio aesculapii TaxID=1142201 RepID=UPI0024BF9ED0|nr:acylphosphatase-2 isoform X2 [Danio aesculapii]